MSQSLPSLPETLSIDRERGLFRVARRNYVDPAIHRREIEQVFGRCWLYVGHASELAEPDRFVTRKVADRSVIFLRDRNGELRCFLNVCPHRGAQLTRHVSGRARNFSCIYHGWGFENTGRVAHIAEAEHYGQAWRDVGRDLVPVPRFESYRGFCFLNFDADAVGLREYLAGACDYIDLVADQSEHEMRVFGDPLQYSARANWKLLAENSTDVLHVQTLHPTYLDLIATNSQGAIRRGKLDGGSVDLGNGHSVVERQATYGRPVAQWISLWGEDARVEIERVRERLVRDFGAARAERIATRARNLLIFPNLVINDIMSVTVRTFQPVAPDAMSIDVWSLAPAEEFGTPALQRRLTNFLEFLGPAGFATPDDIEALESCQRAFASWREAPWNDLSKGFGAAESHPTDELTQRTFWLRWQAMLKAGEAR